MKSVLTVFSAGIIACAIAQEPAAPPPKEEARPADKAAASPGLTGKLEIHVNGQKRIIDLTQPGKELIETEVDGKKETRVLDSREADALARSLFAGEKMPVRKGPVTYLGVATMEVPREVAAQLPLPPDTGLLVAGIAPESPAAKAGLMESDVITKLDDQIIITSRQLAVLIANHKKEESVRITYFREGQQGELTATLGEREAPPPVDSGNPLARITRFMLMIGPDGKIIRLPKDADLQSLPEALRKEFEEAIKQQKNSTAPPPPADAAQERPNP